MVKRVFKAKGWELEETNKNLDEIVELAKKLQVTHYLRGENYVFWGGWEGYQTLLNTDMKRELDHLANFLQAAVDYKKNGFRAYNRNLPFYSSSERARARHVFVTYIIANRNLSRVRKKKEKTENEIEKEKMMEKRESGTNLVKKVPFLVIINTWLRPVFKQMGLSFTQQQFCKLNLQSPPGRKHYGKHNSNMDYKTECWKNVVNVVVLSAAGMISNHLLFKILLDIFVFNSRRLWYHDCAYATKPYLQKYNGDVFNMTTK
uniref:Xylose isomerase n=1 Tax=Oryza glumipatula TaxID=40148 RepID=A0A0E0AUG0_9ORYZ